jgi:hypothetical protein
LFAASMMREPLWGCFKMFVLAAVLGPVTQAQITCELEDTASMLVNCSGVGLFSFADMGTGCDR